MAIWGGGTSPCRGPVYNQSQFLKNKLLEKYPYQDQMVTNIFLAKAESIRNKST